MSCARTIACRPAHGPAHWPAPVWIALQIAVLGPHLRGLTVAFVVAACLAAVAMGCTAALRTHGRSRWRHEPRLVALAAAAALTALATATLFLPPPGAIAGAVLAALAVLAHIGAWWRR